MIALQHSRQLAKRHSSKYAQRMFQIRLDPSCCIATFID